jgi:hypothetical protein
MQTHSATVKTRPHWARARDLAGGCAWPHLDPQLRLVQRGIDYLRFDLFHVNTADDGTGVDEVLQIVSGAGIVIRYRLPDGNVLALHVDCPDEAAGWLVTLRPQASALGSLSSARSGSKALVQAIGPPRSSVRYTPGA